LFIIRFRTIIYIFKNHELLDVYNKNMLYYLMKERSGLQNKELTYSVGRLKIVYKNFKKLFVKKHLFD